MYIVRVKTEADEEYHYKGANGEFDRGSPSGHLIYCPECGGKIKLKAPEMSLQNNQS